MSVSLVKSFYHGEGSGTEAATDEPSWPEEKYAVLYRDLVSKMESEATVLPGMSTAVGMMIRKLARDYVVGVMADQNEDMLGVLARTQERDRRMLSLFKMLLEQASRSDLEHALRTEFVLGLVTEVMRVLDGEVKDKVLRTKLKELMGSAFVAYTNDVQGRIGK